MVNWDLLIDESALASVLPTDYVRFARPISNGLAVFLEGLPATRQEEILAEQAQLSPDATISERLGVLARCCPVLHKLGQVLARDHRLAPELREQLQRLESLPPTVSHEVLMGILADELGPLDRLGVTVASQPLAEASVATVVGFEQHEKGQVRQGVFKLLKPGIQARLDEELQLTEQVGHHLDERCDELHIPHLDYRDTFEQVRLKLQQEVNLDQEQCHLAEAYYYYGDQPRVQIPKLFDFCSPRVTAMQRVSGGKVTDHRLDSKYERQQLAELIVEALITKPVFSRQSQALFHCDPHAGNLFFTDDGRLAILDWSLIGRLSDEDRVAIVQVLLGAATFDRHRIARVLTQMALRPPQAKALESTVENWLRRIRQGQMPGLQWLIGMLDEAVQTAELRVNTDVLLFRKTLYTLAGVLLDLHLDDRRIDQILLLEFLRNFVAEWPRRWYSLPSSRDFATRLSNLDLTRWMMGLPESTTRLWSGQIRDLLSTPWGSAPCG